MNIAVDDPMGVQVRNTRSELAENTKDLLVGKLVLTKLFPRGNMVWRFRLKNQSLNFVNQNSRL
jgi:hypothetical protein